MATWAKLQPRTGGPAVYVFNTHFDISGESTRDAQAGVLRQQIESIAGDAPVIVTGDFNTTEASPTYRTLLGAGAGLSDSYRTVHTRAGRDERTHHGFSGGTRGQRIDWILTSRHFQTASAAIVRHDRNGKYPSDHFPITAVLSPAGTPATAAATTPQTPTRVQ
jgi:endonuclease/exonuclease/phosphatase family metal-dependent hydrolase